MGLETETYLNDAPAEQDKTDRTDESENEIGQVVYDLDRVACGKRGHAAAHHESKCKDNGDISAVALLDLAGNLRLVGVLLGIKVFHVLFSPFHQ